MTEDSAERFEATGWLDSSEFAVIGAGTSGQAAAALLLDLSSSQIIKLLKEFPPTLMDLNQRRRQRGEPALR